MAHTMKKEKIEKTFKKQQVKNMLVKYEI